VTTYHLAGDQNTEIQSHLPDSLPNDVYWLLLRIS